MLTAKENKPLLLWLCDATLTPAGLESKRRHHASYIFVADKQKCEDWRDRWLVLLLLARRLMRVTESLYFPQRPICAQI